MVEFLTDCYDGKRFGTGFKKDRQASPDRKQWFSYPHLSLIAGAVPTWFMASLKMDLFSGGLGRRLIIVSGERTKVIPFPKKPSGADAALGRVVEHLKNAEKFVGTLHLGDTGRKWWQEWYVKQAKERPEDPIIYQFHQTKPMQVLKIAGLLLMTEKIEPVQIDGEHLEFANVLFDKLIPNIVRLTSGIGRNELAGIGAAVVEFITRTDGMASKVQVQKMFYRFAKTPEFNELIQHHKETGTIIEQTWTDKDGVARTYYFTPEGYKKLTTMQNQLKSKDALLH